MNGPRQREGQGTGLGRRRDDCRTTGRPGGVPGQSEARGGCVSPAGGEGPPAKGGTRSPPSPWRLCRHLDRGGLARHAGGGGMPLRRGGSPQEQRAARARRVRGRCFNRAVLNHGEQGRLCGAGQGPLTESPHDLFKTAR